MIDPALTLGLFLKTGEKEFIGSYFHTGNFNQIVPIIGGYLFKK
jgi:hypothetical protein